MTETVTALTGDYEDWLGRQIPLVAPELERKHQEMQQDVFRFLRGSYFLWLVRVHELVPELGELAAVPLIGDVHVENFGTWRDHDQVRRWGVNDLDELARGSWALDLLRLAVSAALAPHIRLDEKEICAQLLDAWATAKPRIAVDLTEKGAGHLDALVPPFADERKFYAALAAGPSADVPTAVATAAAAVAEPGWAPTWHEHLAGTGSLGHRRLVGVGPAADGRQHAREAKELGPGTCVWAGARVPAPEQGARLYPLVQDAVRGPAGAARPGDWQVRDLAPDVVRIELGGLREKDGVRLLRSMAYAVLDVHGADPTALSKARASVPAEKDFRAAVTTMAASVRADQAAYSKGR